MTADLAQEASCPVVCPVVLRPFQYNAGKRNPGHREHGREGTLARLRCGLLWSPKSGTLVPFALFFVFVQTDFWGTVMHRSSGPSLRIPRRYLGNSLHTFNIFQLWTPRFLSHAAYPVPRRPSLGESKKGAGQILRIGRRSRRRSKRTK